MSEMMMQEIDRLRAELSLARSAQTSASDELDRMARRLVDVEAELERVQRELSGFESRALEFADRAEALEKERDALQARLDADEVYEPVGWADPLSFNNLKVKGHLGPPYGKEWMWHTPTFGMVQIYAKRTDPDMASMSEPAYWRHPHSYGTVSHSRKLREPEDWVHFSQPLYAAPVPASDAKDARRYRFVIKDHWIQERIEILTGINTETLADVDAAIDAAMREGGEG